MNGKPLNEMKVGDTAEVSRVASAGNVAEFIDSVGDHNPIHHDHEYAAKTRFAKPIVPGMWTASLVSAVLGTKLPGPGSIYLHQSLDFVSPVYIGDTITARVAVKHVRPEKGVVTLITTCLNQSAGIVLKGEAVMLVEQP